NLAEVSLPALAVPAEVTVPEVTVRAAVMVTVGRDEEFDRRMEAAGKDVQKLWDVLIWCEDTERPSDARKVLRAIVRESPNHRRARERLAHVRYEGEWFTSPKRLEAHLQKEREREAKEQGLVRYKDEWISPADLVYLKRGLVRGPLGRWITTREARRLEQGWARQDLVWVPPAERDQMEAGLWKCGESWLPLKAANRWHARYQRPWVIPTETLTVWSTAERAVALRAIEVMERAYHDMRRIYGRAPTQPLPVLIMANSEQLSDFSEAGTQAGRSRDGRRLYRALRAVYLESWIEEDPFAWRGAGACFWDGEKKNGDQFGVHDARLALGLSFSHAMDPSPKAVAKIEKKGMSVRFVDEFYSEKRLPAWFRWGAACYASRYYQATVGSGGDPWWPRNWSVENLQAGGGIPFLRAIFDFTPAGDDRGTSRLLNATGLLVAFVVDGDCAPVEAVHAEFVDALGKGADTTEILARLRKEIESHEEELNAFARR
ncbi:MAG: hypothetical protein V3T22_10355, partial [Planctomycetota bacterium]